MNMNNNLSTITIDTIKKYNMISKDDSILVAVSGGPDSVALLQCLNFLKDGLSVSLTVFHLNHKLRGKHSDRDEKFVRGLAKKLKLPLKIISVDTEKYCKKRKLSIEDGARKIRYEKAQKAAEETISNKIATGHTADDAAETFIMRALRGAGLSGLTGIPPVRSNIIRPFIEIYRKQVLEFCDDNSIDYIIDLSNLEPTFFRNKIRLQVMPKLDELYPSWKKNVVKTLEILRNDFEFLSTETDKNFAKISNRINNRIEIYIDKLNELHVSLKRMMIRKAIELIAGDLKQIEYKHIDFIVSKILKIGNFSIDIPGKIVVLREYNKLVFKPIETPKAPIKKKQLIIGGTTYLLQNNIIFKTEIVSPEEVIYDKRVAQLDVSKIDGSLHIRTIEEGDKFIPLGMKGTKKIYDYMSDKKIPRRLRKGSLVVLDSKKILWLVGHEISDLAKIDKRTKRVLIIRSESIEA